jgi:hypothetical protein
LCSSEEVCTARVQAKSREEKSITRREEKRREEKRREEKRRVIVQV